MSCVPLTPEHSRVLALLADRGPVPDDLGPALDDLRHWGWAMESGELTGVGWAHARHGPKGVLGDAPRAGDSADRG